MYITRSCAIGFRDNYVIDIILISYKLDQESCAKYYHVLFKTMVYWSGSRKYKNCETLNGLLYTNTWMHMKPPRPFRLWHQCAISLVGLHDTLVGNQALWVRCWCRRTLILVYLRQRGIKSKNVLGNLWWIQDPLPIFEHVS